MHTPFILRRRATAGTSRGRPRGRAILTLPLLGLVIAAALFLTPALASADSGSTLTVVGTSDVSDSGLIQNVIQPAFNAAYPQFSFKYIGSATGAAIQSAESGTGGPSALIVHAPSLENQFVAGGYSYNNYYGNAIFTNDFVLAGPTADPAGASVNAANNIAQAFADVATAGVGGTATFISRGGTTTASGTTVEEHALWALMNSAGLTPAGVTLCNVSAADGGGMSPVLATVPLLANQGCPDSGTVTQADAPSWYFINSGANQGANVVATNACTATGITSGANSCYSLTDRGTFDYLASGGTAAGGPNVIPNLKAVTQNNSASAPGGAYELVNYFHVYIINPNAPGQSVNLPAAQDFVSLLTSPAFQAKLPGYLSNISSTPVFNPTASPSLTANWSATSIAANGTVTVTGQLTNREPGYPPLAGRTVTVNQVSGLTSVPLGTVNTNSTGAYSITFRPPATGSYQISTGILSVVEILSLTPPYGDTLAPASTAAQTITVASSPPPTPLTATVNIATSSTGVRSVTASGSVTPAAPDARATITLLARPRTSKGSFSTVTSKTLAAGAKTYSITGTKPGGNWTIQVQYADAGVLKTATSATRNVTVVNLSNPIKLTKVSASRTRTVSVSGSVGQAPQATNATVKLFVRTRSGKYRQVAKATLKKGKSTFTIKHTFAKGAVRLRLQYSNRSQHTTNSGTKRVTVK